ncbi:MAG: response regulator, partial [Myxococcales bacterium]|nr:response regulator [Myxococcales bacterium]
MKRVMFIDDDPNMLGGLERMLFDYADEWDLCFVAGGQQALDKIAADGADVVVTDMRMPGMGGAELLERLQAEHPSIARIVLSGHAETEALTRALMVAHTFLAK